MKEVWKDIEGFKYYQVSSLGNVRSLDKTIKDSIGRNRLQKGKVLKQALNKRGNRYHIISLQKEGKRVTKYVHRLVLKTFVENVNNYPQVNHINGNSRDNNLSNLEWVTRDMNMKHASETGLMKGRKGENHHGNKLTEEDVRDIRNIEGVYQKDIAFLYNVSRATISDIINKKKWSHV